MTAVDRPPASAGVFYVATEHTRFIVEAARSAVSLRRWLPSLQITLFTDRPGPLEAVDVFDRIEHLPHAEGLGTSWGSGLLGKVRSFVRTPYEKSLFLDTDTRVLSGRLAEVFDVLDRYELAISRCLPGESRNQMLLGAPVFNSGVIAFRRTMRVERLLDAWLERQQSHADSIRAGTMNRFEYVRHVEGVEKLFQLVNDQTALAQFLTPDVNTFGISYVELPRVWNWRVDDLSPAAGEEVIVHHAAIYKARQ